MSKRRKYLYGYFYFVHVSTLKIKIETIKEYDFMLQVKARHKDYKLCYPHYWTSATSVNETPALFLERSYSRKTFEKDLTYRTTAELNKLYGLNFNHRTYGILRKRLNVVYEAVKHNYVEGTGPVKRRKPGQVAAESTKAPGKIDLNTHWPCNIPKSVKTKCRAKHCYHKVRCAAYTEKDKHGFHLGFAW